jgi:hypothetical protein
VGSHPVARTTFVALVAAAAGCGGDGSAAPSKPAYVKQADAICRQGTAQLQSAANRYFSGTTDPTPEQETEYVAKVFVPNLERQLAKLRKLTAPDGDEDAVTAIWDASADGLAEIKARHGPPGPPPAGFKKAHTLAVKYGLKVCGST